MNNLANTLKTLMNEPSDDKIVERMEKVVNYSPETEFTQLDVLLKYVGQIENKSDMAYCSTTLNNIREFLKIYHRDTNLAVVKFNQQLTTGQYIEWTLLNHNQIESASVMCVPIRVIKRNIRKKLIIDETPVKRYLELNHNFEVTDNEFNG